MPQSQDYANYRELHGVVPAIDQEQFEASSCKQIVDADTRGHPA
jgi:hypothetical protein